MRIVGNWNDQSPTFKTIVVYPAIAIIKDSYGWGIGFHWLTTWVSIYFS